MTVPGGSLREWLAGLPRRGVGEVGEVGSIISRADLGVLVRSGVPAPDVMAYRDAVHAITGEDLAVDVAADRLCTDLVVLALSWQGMSMRAGLGWALVACADVRRVSQVDGRPVPWNEVEEDVAPWDTVGLAEGGSLFAAAGLNPDEAQDLLAAGPVDEDALVALAALRGVALPVRWDLLG